METTNYSTLTGSTVNAFQVIAQGQIKSVGPTGQRITVNINSNSPYNINLSQGSFLFLNLTANNLTVPLTWIPPDGTSNHFAELLYLQVAQNAMISGGSITFGFGLGTTTATLSVDTGYMMQFICDGAHLLEVSRANWGAHMP